MTLPEAVLAKSMVLSRTFIGVLFFVGVLRADAQPHTVGSLDGEFSVSDAGAAQYSIPISAPPGTAGIEPKLALNYNSGSSNGVVGVGWSLDDMAAIARCPATIAQDGYVQGVRFNTQDRACFQGQRLVAVQGNYWASGSVYRTEVESFADFVFDDASGSWRMRSKAGLLYEFGSTSDSKVEGQGRSEVMQWRVSKVSDRSGNYMNYTYFEDSQLGESYPLRIDYTGNSQLPYNSVRFVYEARQDSVYGFVTGSRTALTRRLKEINLYVQNTLVRGYQLIYDSGSVSGRSRLTQVLECDPSGECLHPTSFTWSNGSLNMGPQVLALNHGSFGQVYPPTGHELSTADLNGDGKSDRIWQPHSWWAYPQGLASGYRQIAYPSGGVFQTPPVTYFPDNALQRPYFEYADANGDGRLDRIELWRSSNSIKVGLFQGDSFLPVTNWLVGGDIYNTEYQERDSSEHWVDVNGDGRVDHLFANQGRLMVSYSTGSYFTSPVQIIFPTDGCTAYSQGGGLEEFADVTGDGLPDWIYRSINCNDRIFVARNLGGVFAAPVVWFDQNALQMSVQEDYRMFADVNGDGIADFIFRSWGWGRVYVAISTGTGFLAPVMWREEHSIDGRSPWSGDHARHFMADMNGDGLADFVTNPDGLRGWYVMYSSGAGFSGVQQILAPTVSYNNQTYDLWHEHVDWVDHNGDGLLDFSYVIDELNAPSLFLRIREGEYPDLLKSITNGFGARTNVEYKTLSDSTVYAKGSSATYPNVDFQGAMYVVSAYEHDNGRGGFRRTTYYYAGFQFEINGRGSNGFSSIQRTDVESGHWTKTWYRQDFPFKGQISRVVTGLANNTVITDSVNSWDSLGLNNNRTHFPFVDRSTSAEFELNGVAVRSSATSYYYDNWGNTTQSMTIRSDGSSEATLTSFNNDVDQWLIGQVLSIAVTKQGAGPNPPPALTKNTAFSFLPVSGLLRSETVEPGNGSISITKTYQYDSFGNIVQTTLSGANVSSRVNTSLFDSRGQFVVSKTNALQHTETATFDPRHGLSTSVTDPNGLTSYKSYDAFGRVVSETSVDGTISATSYLASDANSPQNTAFRVRIDKTGSVPSIVYYDSLGRELRRETRGFNGQRLLIDREYDQRGNVFKVSDPYFVGNSIGWTTYSYDDLDRTVAVVASSGDQTGYVYTGLTTSVINALGHLSSQTVDAQGQLVSSTDAHGSTLQIRRDSHGNVIQVTDPTGSITSAQYDIAGRRVLLNDPNAGINTYSYDCFGQLVQQVTALGQTISFSYDLLGRMVSRATSGGVDTWQYDQGFKAIGKLSRVAGSNGFVEQYGFDLLGRLVATQTTAGRNRYLITQSYGMYSRPDVLTYPTQFATRNVYNADGYLTQIQRVSDGSMIWQANARNARGQLEQQAYGNGLVTQQQFEPDRGYLQRITTGSVQDLSFLFDALGNLTERRDLQVGTQENFTYDSLSRLTSSQVVGQSAVTVAYNSVGNIVSRSDVGSYVYGGNGGGPHAVSQIVGPRADTYTYDLSGNRISSLAGNISYNPFGKPLSISKGNVGIQFSLAPSGSRFLERTFISGVEKQRKTIIGQGVFEEISDGRGVTGVHYVRSPDGLVAIWRVNYPKLSPTTIPGSGTLTSMQYILSDHLGSVQCVTDQNGRLIEKQSYDSWGNRRDSTNWAPPSYAISSRVPRGYTGHEQLDAVGLIHMNGRVYDPVIGRFISPDPFVQDPGNLQGYNRYSYVNNNPLSATDPTGYFSKKLLRKARQFFRQVTPVVVAITSTIAMPWMTPAALAAMPTIQAVATVAATGAGVGVLSGVTSSLVNGQGVGAGLRIGLRGAPMNALQSLGAWGIGNVFGEKGILHGEFGNASGAVKAVAHGIVGGTSAVVGRQSFLSGFTAGLGGELAAGGGPASAALAGGTAAAISGGKFADGALRGSFVYLYNRCLHDGGESRSKSGTEALTLSFTSLMSLAYDKTADVVGGDWKVPGVSGLLSRGLAVFGLAENVISVGNSPGDMRAQLELVMSVSGFIPAVSSLSLGYDVGKAAAYGVDALGGFDLWVEYRDRFHFN